MHAGIVHSTRVIDRGEMRTLLPGSQLRVSTTRERFPGFIVNDKIVHVTDFTVGRMDMAVGDLPCAAQMRVIPAPYTGVSCSTDTSSPGRGNGVVPKSPSVTSSPWPLIVLMQRGFMLKIDRPLCMDGGAAAHLTTAEVYRNLA